MGFEKIDEKVNIKIKEFIEEKYEEIMKELRDKELGEVAPADLLEKVKDKIPFVAEYIASKGIDYFSSDEGKRKVRKMIDDFLATRGMLGNMLQMFLGNESLIDKIQPEIVKFLSSKGTKDLLTTLLENERDKVKKWKAIELEEKNGRNVIVTL